MRRGNRLSALCGDTLAFFGNLLAPDDCRLCGLPLQDFRRVPVCADCLAKPAALDAEYFCLQCRTPFVSAAPLDESGRCRMCRLDARGYDAAYSFGEYTGALRRLIHLLKYRGMRSLAELFGQWLAQSLPLDERVDLVVPVPLHWWRKFRRGFNQSEVLASEIARRTGLLCAQDALRRASPTPPQARMSLSQRRKNVASAFTVPDPLVVQGKTILLVDDVLTTGATLGACAKALKKAGARRVVALTLARVDRRAQVEPFPMRRAAKAGAGDPR